MVQLLHGAEGRGDDDVCNGQLTNGMEYTASGEGRDTGSTMPHRAPCQRFRSFGSSTFTAIEAYRQATSSSVPDTYLGTSPVASAEARIRPYLVCDEVHAAPGFEVLGGVAEPPFSSTKEAPREPVQDGIQGRFVARP